MKKAFFIATMFMAFSALSITVPKKVIGQYNAEIPAFEFEEDGEVKKASGFSLSILLRESNLLYRAGSLELKGTYLEVIQNSGLIDIKVAISNSSNINFDLDLSYNKKLRTLSVKGIHGLDEVVCEKKEEVVEKKKGFKRL